VGDDARRRVRVVAVVFHDEDDAVAQAIEQQRSRDWRIICRIEDIEFAL
jgi:hypothetical protein